MKILMIHPDRDEMYGAVHSMLELLTCLNKEHDVEPVVLTSTYGNVAKYCEKMGWEYYITKHGNFMMGANTKSKQIIRTIFLPIFYLKYKIKSMIAIHLAEKYVNFDEIDLIHTNTNVCDIGAILAKRHNKPHFWHLREFGDLDYNRISFRKNYIQYMNDNTTIFFAISEAVKEYWIGKGLDRNKVVRVYNGVKIIEGKSAPLLSKNGKLKIVFSGSISQSKGQYIMIDAISKISNEKLKNIEVDIIGDGPQNYVKKLKNDVNQKHLTNVIRFLGYQENVRALLPNYDIGLMCSKSEGFGRVTIEYMMAGLYTIASNTGANLELINNENGTLFEYPNSNDLKEKIEWAIDNKDKIREIGEYSKIYATKKFSSNVNANNIYNSYSKVIGGNDE